MIVAAGIYIGGNFAIYYSVTTKTNPLAKGFYGASVVFSSTAIANGGVGVMASTCPISEVTFLTEAFGAGFMILGNFAHVRALELEGKPIPHICNYSI